MSRRLLHQLSRMVSDQSTRARKGASKSSPLPGSDIEQDYTDDLESMFYVFCFICIQHSGPLGVERRLDTSWLPHVWNHVDIKRCFDSKVTFYVATGHSDIDDQFDKYFKDLLPLAHDWMNLLRDNFPGDGGPQHKPITFDALLDLLKQHIARLAVEPEPDPERLIRQRALEQSKKELEAKGNIIRGMGPEGKKRSANEAWTVEAVKRSKH